MKMIDVQKQIAYWRDGAVEDWQVADELIHAGRIRHGLFFAHLALEKILKAHICLRTQDLPPRIHNLIRLAETASINLTDQQLDVLAAINSFNLAGRYPENLLPLPTRDEALAYLNQAKEVYKWLMSQLP